MSNIKMGSAEYRALIRRQCELLTLGMTTGLTYAEHKELGDVSDKMAVIEMAHADELIKTGKAT